MPVVIGGDNLPSPVGIGLTDLPNIGGASGPPGPPSSGTAGAAWAPLCWAAIAGCLRGLRGYFHKINPFHSYFFPVLIAASFSVCYALLCLTTDTLQCFRAAWASLGCLRGLRGYLHKINPFHSYFFQF